MGVWGAGNFANDIALDYVHELVDQMVEEIEATVASEHGMQPDEPANFRMMCNIDLICLIVNRVGLSLMESSKVADWKTRYLSVWEEYIDGLDPKPDYKNDRRAAITESFDQLITLCQGQEQIPDEPSD